MKKNDNLAPNLVLAGFAIITLGLTIFFSILAVKSPRATELGALPMAIIIGIITFAIYVALITGLVCIIIDKKVLKNGVDTIGKIISAKLVFSQTMKPVPTNFIEEDFNNKPICFIGQYQIKVAFKNQNGKEVQKSLKLCPNINSKQLSYLIERGSINIKIYKNHFSYTQEMYEEDIKNMPPDFNSIKLKNDKAKIKTRLYFSKSKKIDNAISTNATDYVLTIYRGHGHRTEYNTPVMYKVFYKYTINETEQIALKFLNVRDFSRIQANQAQKLPLPLLINKNKSYIDFDNLPIV